jgi:hypothetical protein
MDADCFLQLLRFCIQLESLSVDRFFTQPQFSYREVAPTLRKIKARELNGAQLAEVLARTGGYLQDLRTSIMGEDEPAEQQVNQQQLDHFFGGLKWSFLIMNVFIFLVKKLQQLMISDSCDPFNYFICKDSFEQ